MSDHFPSGSSSLAFFFVSGKEMIESQLLMKVKKMSLPK